MSTILDLNDNCITLTGLFNKITQAFVNDATATVTIKDGDTTLIAAQAMPYVAASDGVYQTVILSTTAFPSTPVSVEINATAGDGSDYQAKDEQVYIAPRKLSGF